MPDPINPWKGLKQFLELLHKRRTVVPDPINPWKGLKQDMEDVWVNAPQVPDPINPWKGLKLGQRTPNIQRLVGCQTPLIPGRD